MSKKDKYIKPNLDEVLEKLVPIENRTFDTESEVVVNTLKHVYLVATNDDTFSDITFSDKEILTLTGVEELKKFISARHTAPDSLDKVALRYMVRVAFAFLIEATRAYEHDKNVNSKAWLLLIEAVRYSTFALQTVSSHNGFLSWHASNNSKKAHEKDYALRDQILNDYAANKFKYTKNKKPNKDAAAEALAKIYPLEVETIRKYLINK